MGTNNPEYQREYRKKNRERLLEYYRERHKKNRSSAEWLSSAKQRNREYWKTMRHDAIMAYGGYACACCGETEPLFLTIDHVNNDGAAHRRSLGCLYRNGSGGNTRTLSWLKKNNYPAGFQILCMNCNLGKQRNGGTCPHGVVHERLRAQKQGSEFDTVRV